MEYILTIAGLIMWGYKSNLFKKVLDNFNYITLTTIYFLVQGLLMTIFGVFVIKTNMLTLATKPYFYVLIIVEFLSGIGMGILFKRSNATFAIALISGANMIASLIYSKRGYIGAVTVLVSICAVALLLYFKESKAKLNLVDGLLSIIFLFVPTLIGSLYIPAITQDYGNALGVYGITRVLPFLVFSLLKVKDVRKGTEINTTIISALISSIGHFLIFYSFSITSSNSILLFILAFEAGITEITAYCFFKKDQYKLDLGKKSVLQFSSIVIFSICSA